jgi:hypothetical protein
VAFCGNIISKGGKAAGAGLQQCSTAFKDHLIKDLVCLLFSSKLFNIRLNLFQKDKVKFL